MSDQERSVVRRRRTLRRKLRRARWMAAQITGERGMGAKSACRARNVELYIWLALSRLNQIPQRRH